MRITITGDGHRVEDRPEAPVQPRLPAPVAILLALGAAAAALLVIAGPDGRAAIQRDASAFSHAVP